MINIKSYSISLVQTLQQLGGDLSKVRTFRHMDVEGIYVDEGNGNAGVIYQIVDESTPYGNNESARVMDALQREIGGVKNIKHQIKLVPNDPFTNLPQSMACMVAAWLSSDTNPKDEGTPIAEEKPEVCRRIEEAVGASSHPDSSDKATGQDNLHEVIALLKTLTTQMRENNRLLSDMNTKLRRMDSNIETMRLRPWSQH